MEETKIALLGLGLMGSGMANRLLDAGYPLSVWNRNPDKTQPLAARGATVAKSPRQAAAGASVVLSMLSDSRYAGTCGWVEAKRSWVRPRESS